MGTYFQAIAGVLIAVIMSALLSRFGKDVALVLSMAVCCMVLITAGAFLQPILDFIQKLAFTSNISADWIAILLKSIGIALIGQFAELVCIDSGNSSMAKSVQILTTVVILWLSIPLMEALLELIQKMAGEG